MFEIKVVFKTYAEWESLPLYIFKPRSSWWEFLLFFYCIINPSCRLHHILHGCKHVSWFHCYPHQLGSLLFCADQLPSGCDSIVVQAFITTRFSVFVPCCLHGSSVCCDLQSPVFIERSCLNWDQKDKRSSSIPAPFLTRKKLFLKPSLNIFRKSPHSGLWQPYIWIHSRSLQLMW